MNVRRGDVVLVDFPFSTGTASKVRPALIVQNDRDNQRLQNTIIAQITSTTYRAIESTQVLIDLNSPAGRQAGIRTDSVVNCVNLATVSMQKVLVRIGDLDQMLLQKVNESLKAALEL
jgi:mRNA interferase MazF